MILFNPRQLLASLWLPMSAASLLLALLLGGCRGLDVYHTYPLERLPQMEKLFADLKDKKLKRILLKTLMVQKIREIGRAHV